MKLNSTICMELLDTLFEGVYILDRDRKILFWNKAAERMTGYQADDVIGKSCKDQILVHMDEQGNDLCKGNCCPATQAMCNGRSHVASIFLLHKDGHRVPIITHITPLRDDNDEVVGAIEIFTDNTLQISEQQKVDELKDLDLLDPVTSLGNRKHAEKNIHVRFDEMRRYGWNFGVILIDIDHFKNVNEKHGHIIGNRILLMVAKTLENCVRATDSISRLEGDKYISVVSNIQSTNKLAYIANKYRAFVKKSGIVLASDKEEVSVSIGATLARSYDTLESIMERTGKLLEQSKLSGRNRISIHQDDALVTENN